MHKMYKKLNSKFGRRYRSSNNNIVTSFVPSAITQPFFELQTPDFARKFVWTVATNYTK